MIIKVRIKILYVCYQHPMCFLHDLSELSDNGCCCFKVYISINTRVE